MWKPYHHADPIVRDSSNANRGTIEILVGKHVIELSEEQARNLWGELGSVLRKRNKRPSGLSNKE